MTKRASAIGHQTAPWSTALMWVAVAVLTIGNPLLHKTVSDVADYLRALWGYRAYDLAALIAIPLASLLAATPVVMRGRAFLRRPATLAAMGVLLVASAAAQHWLLVVNVELVHLPQFALIAGLALAAGASAPAAFVVATLAGVVDETYQHLVIYAGTPGTYFDINDIVLNGIGAAWGVLLFAGAATRDASASARRIESWVTRRWKSAAGAAAVAVAIAWWWDPPVFSPLFRTTVGGHPFYRVLSTAEGLVALAMLAAIVVMPWSRANGDKGDGDRAAVDAARLASAAPALSLLLLLVLPGCAAISPRPGAVAATPARSAPFITTFWCGPPLAEFDDRQAAAIVAAGFSVVGPPCEGPITPEGNRKALDVAARHGLSMWISDARYSAEVTKYPDWESALDAAVAEYRSYPALSGYFVTDEPSFDQFESVRAVVARLRVADPRRLAYVNLNPDYVFGSNAATAYPVYVERFIAMVRPSLLSYDYYPFLSTGDRGSFFRSLALIRDLGERHDLPFLLIILAMPHAAYRDPTEGELSWQAYHALAYGAAGVSYFAYWTPVAVEFAQLLQFRHGLIENGKPTRHLSDASRLNQRLRTIASELTSFRSVSVRDSRGDIAAPLPFGPLEAITGGEVTAGFFQHQDGRLMALLVNRDYRRDAEVTLQSRRADGRVEGFTADSGKWSGLRHDRLRLEAGGARLIRWRK